MGTLNNSEMGDVRFSSGSRPEDSAAVADSAVLGRSRTQEKESREVTL
jgi:hypothetical protein